jgi:THO complex subunit 2
VIHTISASDILPAEAQTIMGTPFFVTFWQLTLYDIVYPKERYDAELGRLTALQREVNTSATMKADDKERFAKHVLDLAKRLAEEASHHSLARNATSRRLLREARHWFTGEKQQRRRAAT